MGQGCFRRADTADKVRALAERTIKAVLFDIGDTLFNFGKVHTTKVFLQSARQTYDYLKSLGQPKLIQFCLEGTDGDTRLFCKALRLLQSLFRNVERMDFIPVASEEHGITALTTADI